MDGREFFGSLPERPTDEREQRMLEAALAGHHEPVHWTVLKLEARGHTAELRVMTDALRIGDQHGIRASWRHPTTEALNDHFDCVNPTAKILDQMWLQSEHQLSPCLQTPDAQMAYTSRMVQHDECVSHARAGFQAGADVLCGPLGKSWHNTNKLAGRPQRSAEYGLHDPAAPYQGVTPGVRVWQPSPGMTHVAGFSDYLTGMYQAVAKQMVVDGAPRAFEDVAADPELCWLVSTEGPLHTLRHPAVPRVGAAKHAPPDTVRPPLPLWTRTIRRGSVGDDVAAWQRVIGVADDGVFGPKTQERTRAWQTSRGLVSDGIVGPRTRAAALREIGAGHAVAAPDGTYLGEVDVLEIPYQQAKYFTWSDRAVCHWIVLHSMEWAEKPNTAEACANMFSGKWEEAPRASAHYCIDVDSIVCSVRENHVAWHAKKANRFGIGYEHAGFHRQSRAEWLDEYSETMLHNSARLAAHRTIPRWNIPVQFVTREQLRSAYADYIDRGLPVPEELRGFTTHREVTYGLGGSHVDPGEHFPTDRYFDMVRDAQGERP